MATDKEKEATGLIMSAVIMGMNKDCEAIISENVFYLTLRNNTYRVTVEEDEIDDPAKA